MCEKFLSLLALGRQFGDVTPQHPAVDLPTRSPAVRTRYRRSLHSPLLGQGVQEFPLIGGVDHFHHEHQAPEHLHLVNADSPLLNY